MQTPAGIERAAQERVRQSDKQICDRMEKILDGNPLAAEPSEQRLVARLQTKASLSREEAMAVADGVHRLSQVQSSEEAKGRAKARGKRKASTNGKVALARTILATKTGGAERIYGSTIDFVGIAFLQRGFRAARAVARVAFRDGRAQGSGVMISDRLFLTNNHVIPSADAAGQFCIEFDYELDPADRPLGITRFAFSPSDFFVTDGTDDLDYTLIAVGPKLSGPKDLSVFGWCVLNNKGDKHALGEVANIVQHPDGRYKEVVLRENRLVNRLDTVLHYVADTEPGSSGSPVFNNEWRMIALHHWGGPWRQQTDPKGRPLPSEVNEGIRVSAIVSELLQRQSELGAPQRQLLKRALEIGAAEQDPPDVPEQNGNGNGHSTAPIARLTPDGLVTWQVPFELSVRLPWHTPPVSPLPTVATIADTVDSVPLLEATIKPSKNYENRSGYKPAFITGFTIDLPKLSSAQKQIAAKNKQADAGDDPFELKYHHFSVVMNAKRRLAFFTACNIDGSRSKHVDRKTGKVTDLDPDDPALESLIADAEGAEASEQWFDDDRLDPGQFAGKDIYDKQKVDGFPSGMGRTLRMFQRGHLVRRMDPAWGTDNQALVADADTFHFTNACPQVGFFNMGQAKSLNLPNTGGGRLWRAIENYVLRNAAADKQRVSVFTGPVFHNNDRKFRSIKIPGRFWKIVVWSDEGELRSAAMIADQRPVISVFPEAMGDLSEAFADEADLNKVKDFLTTVKKIEELTGLKFDAEMKAGDINAGGNESMKLVRDFESIELRPRTRKGRR